jgi:ribosome recycling factor
MKDLSKDDVTGSTGQITDLTEEFLKKIDTMVKSKEGDLKKL